MANIATPPESPGVEAPARLVSLDAYRGFVMLAMASGAFAFTRVVGRHTELLESPFWQVLAFEFDHVYWAGWSLWDLIQPSFMFMVGVALPYSYASRKVKGDSETRIFSHVLRRSLILVLLGIFLSSNGERSTDVAFVNVLTQIGLGYWLVFLLLNRGLLIQMAAVAAILAFSWFLFYNHPLPGPDFNYQAVEANGSARLPGTFAHWTKNANYASDFDRWFLNLFRRSKPIRFQFAGREWTSDLFYRANSEGAPQVFQYNRGGYQTLNFIPSMATMLFGLMAGEMLRGRKDLQTKLRFLILASALCLGTGVAMAHYACPSVKRIWTPSWAVYSAGLTFGTLAFFFWLIDVRGYRRWTFPLVVVGMNSIAMYCLAQLSKGWIRQTLKTHFGQRIFTGTYGPILESVAILLMLWSICWWLYRQRIFVRI